MVGFLILAGKLIREIQLDIVLIKKRLDFEFIQGKVAEWRWKARDLNGKKLNRRPSKKQKSLQVIDERGYGRQEKDKKVVIQQRQVRNFFL